AAFREGGTRPLGLTPRYAAPELFEGGALTVRAEVFALGATLGDVLEVVRGGLDARTASALSEIVERATRSRPEERFTSADEFASELRRAAPSILGNGRAVAGAAWPIVGLDEPSRALFERVTKLEAGGGVVVTGPLLAGKSTLLRRLAWSLGAYGRHVAWVQGGDQAMGELDLEMAGASSPSDVVLLVDDADRLPDSAGARLGELRAQGARVVIVTGAGGDAPIPGPTLEVFEIAPLGSNVVRDLALLAIPSLPQLALARVLELAEGRPGRLRAVVERLDGAPVVGGDDVDRLVPPDLFSISRGARERARPRGKAQLAEVREALLRGHFEDAADLLATLDGEHTFELGVMRAKLFTNQGEWKRAQEELGGLDPKGADPAVVLEYFVELARANLRGGDYAACVKAAEMLEARERAAGDRRALASFAEALALGGMALSFLGDLERSKAMHDRSIEAARELADPRVLSVALSSAAFSLQRQGRLEEARPCYEEALENAERAGDAGTVATTRLNLAGIAKTQGDLSRALAHLEAAVDMGRRSGRRATLRQALLNLANLDLYLGRLARALVSIEQLAAERRDLPPSFAAQLLSLESEAAHKSGDLVKAEALCIACARAYETVGRRVDAAEAHLESVFIRLSRSPSSDAASEISELERRLGEIGPALADVSSHRAALELARGKVAALKGETVQGRAAFDKSIEAAIATGKKDWLARAYQARAVLSAEDGQLLAARRDRESALGVLEEIAARLPRDLREVFWDDPNRRSLREGEHDRHVTLASPHSSVHAAAPGVTQQARISQDRLARVLEVNRELAGTYELRRVLERLTDHAIALLSAERGFVILKSARENTDFSIHASRDQAGDDPHARFSQSIADRVIRTGEPVVTTSARDDSRMADYVSVHQLMLQSIACVPIRSRSAGTIGALYLETRMRSAATFNDDLPLLVAMADQAEIAIETARL
ncbi:MAG: tetratricopeptide repeat protein, partial [Polyangiaceae bacterium]|nr:tetratricopeptide repeat protein [Polyangiaceae bacterium]